MKKLTVEDKIIRKHENVPIRIFNGSGEGSVWIAQQISDLIREKEDKNETCVLGLATGSSPIGVYRELVRMHREEGLSFKNVITFNLDEYYPMEPSRVQSYVAFMHRHLFNHIDIKTENIHIPDGTVDRDKIFDYCNFYEEQIEAAGGLDMQILGIGRTGHIGFNEPGSGIGSPTRLISLDYITMSDAATDFGSFNLVPRRAITMGVGTIMKARRIILMAWGEGKAPIVQQAVEGPVTESVPATFLHKHPNTEFILDNASAGELTRIKTPWQVRDCDWDDRLIRQATVWLCQKLNKPILKLTNRDYNDNKLSDLVALHGPAYDINIKVFNDLQHTITGWPGGKPNADDTHRPAKATPYPKNILVFSPHPDDDIISMGGTLTRLIEQGHKVYVAYQTSGNISIENDEVLKYAEFIDDFNQNHIKNGKITQWTDKVRKSIFTKTNSDNDIPEVQYAKKLIRESETRNVARYINLPERNLFFLDMPFYRTGSIAKKPLSEEDIHMVKQLIEELQPHQIYAAGDMSDPHGTHRICWNAIKKAISDGNTGQRIVDKEWFNETTIWLYRGAWQEWDIGDVDMAVPMSPDQLLFKRYAIFKHQSQKDAPLFMGNDQREFWQRAEDRNISTAKFYNKLGMAEYEALEVFKQWDYRSAEESKF